MLNLKKPYYIQIVHEMLLEGFLVVKLLFHICEMHTEKQ